MTTLSLRRRGIQLFAVLNLLDLALTWNLLRQSPGLVTEGNPLAGWWLNCFGWPGLAAFKLGSVLVPLLLLAAVARHRPAAANRALAFGCAVLLGVVLYSALLARWAATPPAQADVARLARAEAKKQQLEQEMERRKEFREDLERLGEDLRAGRRKLDEAVSVLWESELVEDPDWLQRVKESYSCPTEDESLAALLMDDTLASLQPGTDEGALANRLEAEYRACYGHPSPLAQRRCPGIAPGQRGLTRSALVYPRSRKERSNQQK
ncbi:MAG TPA: DUF5658 family protein [Gemmataceae bacterium]|nr:DUF5658 family protein [Gemmataceae bacterium]